MSTRLPEPVRRLFLPAALGLAALLGVVTCSQTTQVSSSAGSSITAATALPPTFPGASWERISEPATAGFSRSGLDSALAFLGTLETTGAVVAVGGRVLVEYGNVTELSYLASVRKSVLAMLYGKYVADGRVRLDKSLAELGIDDIGGLTDQEKEATVADLLAARSGVYHAASNPGDNLADAPPRGSQRHGTYYLYSNWDFNVLGTIFEQETGRNIYDALEADLARPIGMEDFDRAAQQKSGDTTRSVHRAYHMWLSTRDMARIGYLMLRGGNWNGRQVVPADWARQITTPVTRWDEMNPASLRGGRFGYGFLWWIFDGPTATGPWEGAYTGVGAAGQFISVIPKLDMVVAHKTKPGERRSVNGSQYLGFVERVMAAQCGADCAKARDE